MNSLSEHSASERNNDDGNYRNNLIGVYSYSSHNKKATSVKPRSNLMDILNLLWSEFAKTNERHFDLLLSFETSLIHFCKFAPK